MLKTALLNVRNLTVTLLLAAVALFVIPVSAQEPGNKPKEREKPAFSNAFAAGNYRSPGPLHKISVTDRQTVNALTLQGARVIADYGSYVLLQANDVLANTKGAEMVDENNVIWLNAGAIDTTTADAQAKRAGSSGNAGKGMRLIQFVGPIRPEWYQALVATGVRVVTYIPSNSYLVYGTSDHLQNVQNLAANRAMVQWDGTYGAAQRLDPAVTAKPSPGVARVNLSAKGNEQFAIQLVEDTAENASTLALIDRAKQEPIISHDKSLGYVNVKVALPRDAVRQIAERGDVVSIQPWVTPVAMCERQDQIMAGNLTGNGPSTGDYLAYLTGKGFNLSTAASFGVNLSDWGLDNGTTTPDHFVFYTLGDATNASNSRVAYVVPTGSATASDLRACNGHGHLQASIVGGYVPTGPNGGVNFGAFPHADGSGFRWGLGIAPFVKIGVSVIFGATGFTFPDYEDLESDAYNAGMRISSNSWGGSPTFTEGEYNSDSQRYDALVRDAQPAGSTHPTAGNQEYTILFAAGNSSNTIAVPGTAKNIITVGASENVNPFGGAADCNHDDSQADNANDIASFSCRGPTTDQRTKPEIVGPGTHVSGAAPQNGPNTARTGNGAHLMCFSGFAPCGLGSAFFPPGQEWYTASSGTSFSCPAVAATVSLYRQYFIDHSMTPPSPALNKALLIISSRYLNGVGANDTLPSNSQGMGEPNLNTFFDIFGSSHVIHDESPGDLFTGSGQQRIITGNVGNSAKPFRVTLAWTDPPGPTSGYAYVNDLDLEVTVGGNTYKGNVFSGANSITGGSADTRNNFESVFVPAGVSGTYTIKVTATNIAGDGVPGNGNSLDQDFALIVYNGNEAPAPVVASSGTTLTGENCIPGNGVIDPGETVSVSVCLQNVGTANTSNLVGTLQASGGVTNPSGAQNYGTLIAGGAAVCRTFTFTASANCGGTIAGTIHLQDGMTDLGNVTFNFTLGVVQLTLSQNFDGVSAAALPSGWTADQGVNAAGAPPWGTSNSGTPAPVADSAPNAAYTQDPVNTCDNRLYTPTFTYMGPAQMSCRMNYDLEVSSAPGIAYDAGVLEISINGGAYTDIIAAGGSWVTGGYNQTGINTGFSNPLLPSRPCWSGVSGGFVTTTVNLPPSGVNQPVKLRWRMGSDNVTSHAGWRVDNVTIAGNYNCCPGPPTVTSAVSRKTHGGAGTFDVSLPLTGTPGIECRSGQGTGGMDHQMVVTFANPVTVGGASVTSGTGSVVGSPIVAGNAVTINLTGVTNIQTIMVTLSNVSDGVTTGNVVVPMSVLLGDVSGNGAVSSNDLTLTKAQVGLPVNTGNFREDVVVSGAINNSDVSVVKLQSGTALP